MSDHQIKGHLFNILVYTDQENRTLYFHKIVDTFIKQYPCRVIFIQAGTGLSAEHLDVDKSTEDTITIRASYSAIERIPFVVLPLLIPDLPTYLVWGQDPTTDNALLPQLEKFATRLVYHAECTPDFNQFCEKMLAKLPQLSGAFMDMSWAQISGWRDVFAKTFCSEETLSILNQSKEITIQYNASNDDTGNQSAIQALYLQGWLASRLEWTFTSIDNHTLTYATPVAAVRVHLLPQKRTTLDEGKIFEVSLTSIEDVTMTLTFAEQQGKVIIYHSTKDHCDLPYSFAMKEIEKGMTGIKEVFYKTPSEHYRSTLELLNTIHWRKTS